MKCPQSFQVNVACGDRFSLNELVRHINTHAGTSIEPEYGPVRAGDVPHSQADITLARRVLGYEPQVSFEEGLARTVAWYRENLGA